MCCLSFYTTIVHLLCQTCQNEKENYIFLSRYQQTTYSVPLFLPCFWGVALCPTAIFLGAFCPTPFEAFCPAYSKSIFTNSLQRYPPWHYAPPLPWHFAPPWHYAPAFFAHFFILAKFSLFWHDFRPEFYFWHAINPYHQRSYKVPWFCRRKSLVSKGLRRAGWGSVDVSRCHIRG